MTISADQVSSILDLIWFSDFIANNCFTQLAFTCSKLTIETLEQGVKYVQS